jgi:hypothetical protein
MHVSHTLGEEKKRDREGKRERYFSLVVVQKKTYRDFLLSGRREEKRSDTIFFSTAAGE